VLCVTVEVFLYLEVYTIDKTWSLLKMNAVTWRFFPLRLRATHFSLAIQLSTTSDDGYSIVCLCTARTMAVATPTHSLPSSQEHNKPQISNKLGWCVTCISPHVSRNAVTLERAVVSRRSAYLCCSFRDSGHVQAFKYSIRATPATAVDPTAMKQREAPENRTVNRQNDDPVGLVRSPTRSQSFRRVKLGLEHHQRHPDPPSSSFYNAMVLIISFWS